MLEEINRDSEEPSEVLLKFSPETRQETWEELGILPGGPLHELMDVKTSVMTNVDSDYKSMALKTLRMGLATSYGSLTLLEEIQDTCEEMIEKLSERVKTPSPEDKIEFFSDGNNDYTSVLKNQACRI